jgi:hypothetical protein
MVKITVKCPYCGSGSCAKRVEKALREQTIEKLDINAQTDHNLMHNQRFGKTYGFSCQALHPCA